MGKMTEFLQRRVELVLLMVAFVILGLTAMIAKMTGIRFLDLSKRPRWEQADYQADLEKMY
jgi:hypothetical protein